MIPIFGLEFHINGNVRFYPFSSNCGEDVRSEALLLLTTKRLSVSSIMASITCTMAEDYDFVEQYLSFFFIENTAISPLILALRFLCDAMWEQPRNINNIDCLYFTALTNTGYSRALLLGEKHLPPFLSMEEYNGCKNDLPIVGNDDIVVKNFAINFSQQAKAGVFNDVSDEDYAQFLHIVKFASSAFSNKEEMPLFSVAVHLAEYMLRSNQFCELIRDQALYFRRNGCEITKNNFVRPLNMQSGAGSMNKQNKIDENNVVNPVQWNEPVPLPCNFFADVPNKTDGKKHKKKKNRKPNLLDFVKQITSKHVPAEQNMVSETVQDEQTDTLSETEYVDSGDILNSNSISDDTMFNEMDESEFVEMENITGDTTSDVSAVKDLLDPSIVEPVNYSKKEVFHFLQKVSFSEFYDDIRDYVIGHDVELKRVCCYIYSYLRSLIGSGDTERNHFLLTGKSGCGKTEVCRALRKCFKKHDVDIEVVLVNAASITDAGYKGVNLAQALSAFCHNNEEGVGIIFFDEIDKRLFPSRSGDFWGVQDFLSVLDGETIMLDDRNKTDISYSFKNTLIIGLGTFDALRVRREKDVASAIGFTSETMSAEEAYNATFTLNDLAEYMKQFGNQEFLGRFVDVINFSDLTEYDVLTILNQYLKHNFIDNVAYRTREVRVKNKAKKQLVDEALSKRGIRAMFSALKTAILDEIADFAMQYPDCSVCDIVVSSVTPLHVKAIRCDTDFIEK